MRDINFRDMGELRSFLKSVEHAGVSPERIIVDGPPGTAEFMEDYRKDRRRR